MFKFILYVHFGICFDVTGNYFVEKFHTGNLKNKTLLYSDMIFFFLNTLDVGRGTPKFPDHIHTEYTTYYYTGFAINTSLNPSCQYYAFLLFYVIIINIVLTDLIATTSGDAIWDRALIGTV